MGGRSGTSLQQGFDNRQRLSSQFWWSILEHIVKRDRGTRWPANRVCRVWAAYHERERLQVSL